MRYRFDGFELDTGNFRLCAGASVDASPIAVEPLVFDLLQYLIERAGEVVTRDALVARVWKGRVVSDAAIAGTVKAARKALGDDGTAQRFIRTVHGRGFMFVATVERGDASALAIGAPDHGNTLVAPPAIAVLPFVPLQAAPSLALIGDALAQEVILELSRLHWIRVIARGSSFQLRGPETDVTKAGDILGARYIVSGTLLREGKQCALQVELSHAPDADVIWAQRFTIDTQEVMHLRTVVAAEIATVLETRIQFAEAMRASKLATAGLDAWAAYHRGLWHMFRFDPRENDTATALFTLALKHDPRFARAEAALSFTHFQNAFLGFSSDKDGEHAAVRDHAQRALDLDALDPFVQLTMGRSEWLQGRLDDAFPWFEQAIALNPNYALAHYNRGLLRTFASDVDGSEHDVAKAIDLSPIDPLIYAMLTTRALSRVAANDHATAIQWALRATRQPNAHVHIHVIAALTHQLAGERDKARAVSQRVRSDHPDYGREQFLRYFLFRDPMLRARIDGALAAIGL